METQSNRAPRAAICTLGCKVNQYESEAMGEALQREGFVLVGFDETAEVYIINTCTVTAESDRKAGQMIRRAAKKAHHPLVLVTGCMAQTQAERVGAIDGVTAVFGSRNKLDCVRFARQALIEGILPAMSPYFAVYDTDTQPIEPMSLCRSGSDRTRAYIKIEDGCENRCSYCAIPAARGNVVSKAPGDVLSELQALCANGYREIVLTGIEIASYGKDFAGVPYGLIDLLEEADQVEGLLRLRLGSLEPTYMKPDVVRRMGRLTHLTHHFHLSLQSGADAVLRGMRRKYNTAMIRAIMADIRSVMPDVMFTTDIMTGFPRETLSDHKETLSFAREVRFLHIHVFPYSERKNTPAAEMAGRLPTTEKNRRAQELIAVQNEVSAALYRERAEGEPVLEVLCETCEHGIAKGHTANFFEVSAAVDGDIPRGTRMHIQITGAENSMLLGHLTT